MKLWISEYESVPQLFQSILYIITNILWTHFNIGGFQWIWLPEYELGCSPAAMMWMIKLREDPLELLWLYKRANNYIVMVLQACTSNLNVPVWDNFSWAVGFRIEMYFVSFWPHRRINVSSLSVEAERSCRALRQEQSDSVMFRLNLMQMALQTHPTAQRESFSLCTQARINDHSLLINVSLWEGWLTACWETVESDTYAVLFFSLWFTTCLVGLKCSNKTYFIMNYNKINNHLDKQFVH